MTYTYQYVRRRKHIDCGFTAKYRLVGDTYTATKYAIGQKVYHKHGGDWIMVIEDIIIRGDYLCGVYTQTAPLYRTRFLNDNSTGLWGEEVIREK